MLWKQMFCWLFGPCGPSTCDVPDTVTEVDNNSCHEEL